MKVNLENFLPQKLPAIRCAFNYLCDTISVRCYKSSTPLKQFLTFLFTSQREKEAMKDKRNHHGTMDNWNSELITCIVSKNSPYPPTTSGCYGREADRLADKTPVNFVILKIIYKLKYQCSVTIVLAMHVSRLFKVCFEVQCKNLVAIFMILPNILNEFLIE